MEFEVKEVVAYPNVTKVRISTMIKGKVVEEWFGFSSNQYPSGDWPSHVKLWADKVANKSEIDSSHVGKKFVVE